MENVAWFFGQVLFVGTAGAPLVFLNDSERLLSAMGALCMLPMLLASLGAIFTAAGVGDVIATLVGGIIPKGNVTLHHRIRCGTAGTYVCNSIMYNVLYLIDRKFPGVKGGFIHVPYATAQGVGKPNGTPTMEIATMARGIEAAIEAAVSIGTDATDIMGETH